MAELQEPLERRQRRGSLTIYDLTGSGNILVHHVASLVRVGELTGALSACRAWHSMMPDAVRILDGIKPDTTDEMVIALLQRFTRVTCIDLRGCTRLTDRSVAVVATLCPHLIQLILKGCGNLTDAAIIAVANECPKLAQLYVEYCGKLTDAAIIEVANKCPNLAQLNVGWCDKLTRAALKDLEARLPTVISGPTVNIDLN